MVERDDEQMRQVLIIEKHRETQFELRQPMIEEIFAADQRFAGSLDQKVMDRVVIEAWDRAGDLRQQRNRVEDDGDDDEQPQQCLRHRAEPGELDSSLADTLLFMKGS